MIAALAFLPLRFNGNSGAEPELGAMHLLLELAMVASVPFFVVSTTAPLLQHWLSHSKFESRHDPYFLYSASNSGSLLSLLMFPALFEPLMGLRSQTQLWTGVYALLIVLVLSAAILVWKHPVQELGLPHREDRALAPAWKTRAYWLAAAFVPSALMIATTNHISVNLSSVPFLWVVPLAAYLLTFMIAFGKSVRASATRYSVLSRWSPLLLIILSPVIPEIPAQALAINSLLIVGNVAILFIGGYLAHTALAARRPHPLYLTEFYFFMGLGGALGGTFAAIVAPNIFSTILEYPLMVAALPFFRERNSEKSKQNWRDWAYPGGLGLIFAGAWYTLRQVWASQTGNYPKLILYALFFIAVFLFRKKWLQFGLAFTVLLFGYVATRSGYNERGERIYVARNFFGVKTISFDRFFGIRELYHGDTLHGAESIDVKLAGEPLTYYHRTGPAGGVMEMISSRPSQKVGVIGLGAGSMAAYGGPHRSITFFEIDPQTEFVARKYFTYLDRCGAGCTVVVGDGRLSVEREPDGEFDVLMLDAFSSDSIPPHLVSREALQIYLTKLKPDGLLLFHVSSRYFNVARLVAAAITDAGLPSFYQKFIGEHFPYIATADYIVAARRMEDFGTIPKTPGWVRIPPETELPVWTDDHSNVMSVVRWWGE
jgi:hypothetical protein